MYNPLRIYPDEIKLSNPRLVRARIESAALAFARARLELQAAGPGPRAQEYYRNADDDGVPPGRSDYPVSPARRILEGIAADHGVTLAALRGTSRSSVLLRARLEAYYAFTTASPPFPLHVIGELLGRDRTTVMHGARRYAQLHDLPLLDRSTRIAVRGR